MREIIRMIVVLTVISTVSGVALSGLNAMTADIIKTTKLEQSYKPAIETLITGYDNDPIKEFIEIPAGKDEKGRELFKQIFPAKKGGKLYAIGLADTAAGGYGGPITIVMAIDITNDSIMGVKVVDHKETKGMGTNLEAPFLGRFAGKTKADDVKLKAMGGPIDGMSGATFSSTTISKAAQSGIQYYADNKESILSKIK
jgi:electron transport complex protein RnfG